jgi:hypothetical protein
VDLQAHAVAEAVTEALTVAGLLDHLARHRVEVAPAQPCRDGREALFLRAEHERVNLASEI